MSDLIKQAEEWLNDERPLTLRRSQPRDIITALVARVRELEGDNAEYSRQLSSVHPCDGCVVDKLQHISQLESELAKYKVGVEVES